MSAGSQRRATFDDYVSWRSREGSCYVDALCAVLRQLVLLPMIEQRLQAGGQGLELVPPATAATSNSGSACISLPVIYYL